MLTRPCQVQFIQKQLDSQVLEIFLQSYVWIYQAFEGKNHTESVNCDKGGP